MRVRSLSWKHEGAAGLVFGAGSAGSDWKMLSTDATSMP